MTGTTTTIRLLQREQIGDRYALELWTTRFGGATYYLLDNDTIEESTGLPAIVRQDESRQRALPPCHIHDGTICRGCDAPECICCGACECATEAG